MLRGIAILGTLGTNIWILTDPEGIIGYINHLGAPVEDGWGWAERALQQFAQGKYLGLLTIMFGIGLAIQQASAQRAGRRWPGKYPIRAGLLLLDGLLNFLLIAEFDVLMGYALTGLVVAYLLATSERAQRRWLIVQASIHVTMLTLLAVAMTADGGGGGGGAETTPPRREPTNHSASARVVIAIGSRSNRLASSGVGLRVWSSQAK